MVSTLTFQPNIPLSLYIHLPWCIKKCPYCDFNSHELATEKIDEQHYIESLICDLDTALPRIWGRTISSIFIGGGTPSLFSADALNELFSALRARLNINPNIEITLEANPGTADASRFNDYRQIGINRLSIGAQSFNNQKLNALGRIHDAGEAQNAIALAITAGFENINIDLMFGLPEQSICEALHDLEIAIAMAPNHLSWYQLTIEPNTLFNVRPPILPHEDKLWAMQHAGQILLSHSGYKQYEISAYATANNHCQHNLNYWQFGDYLGIGAGAHSKITDFNKMQVIRFKQHQVPARYMELTQKKEAFTTIKTLTKDDLLLEFMMGTMRLNNGVQTTLFTERTGLPLTLLDNKLTLALEKKLIDCSPSRLKPTEKGLHYLNDLLALWI